MHQPTQIPFQQLKRVIQYLKLPFNYGLKLKKPAHMKLHAFSDANWGDYLDDHTSTLTFVIYFGGNSVSWLSKRQRTVARSSPEAEYHSVANAAAEVMWLTNLLSGLHVKTPAPHLFCDNIRAPTYALIQFFTLE